MVKAAAINALDKADPLALFIRRSRRLADSTRDGMIKQIRYFKRWLTEEGVITPSGSDNNYYDLLFNRDGSVIQEHIINYLGYLQSKHIVEASQSNLVNALKLFYELNMITTATIGWKIIKQSIPRTGEAVNAGAYSREQIQEILPFAYLKETDHIVVIFCWF
jgi:hypothetical protein